MTSNINQNFKMFPQLSNQLSSVTSFQSFCAIKPEDLFLLPPNSTWDLDSWMAKLCSVNEAALLGELMQRPSVYKIAMIVRKKLYIFIIVLLHILKGFLKSQLG